MHRNFRLTLIPLLVVAAATAAEPAAAAVPAVETSNGLPKLSPFELRNSRPGPAVAANETIEFAGVSSIGKKTDLIFYDKTAKKSHWIAKGETKEGIAVLNYDERREEAVVKVNGVEKTLALRKGGTMSGAPRPVPNLPVGFNNAVHAPLPAPVSAQLPIPSNMLPAPASIDANAAQATPPPAPGSPAEIQKKQETEARMLVSDLLEIGMAQRRAYEEAQRKASEGGTQPTTSTDATQPAPAQPNQPVR